MIFMQLVILREVLEINMDIHRMIWRRALM